MGYCLKFLELIKNFLDPLGYCLPQAYVGYGWDLVAS